MTIEHNKNKVIGVLPFNFTTEKSLTEKAIENIEFSNMQRELKEHYGSKNVWFDRDRENNKIIFLTFL